MVLKHLTYDDVRAPNFDILNIETKGCKMVNLKENDGTEVKSQNREQCKHGYLEVTLDEGAWGK